jgi:hypothetical protein
MLVGDTYGFTAQDIAGVAVVRITQINHAMIVCRCGHLMLWLTRDTGMSNKWLPAARVLDRLRSGSLIDGRLDR